MSDELLYICPECGAGEVYFRRPDFSGVTQKYRGQYRCGKCKADFYDDEDELDAVGLTKKEEQ